jgi:HEAT repeat protein
MQRNTDCRSRLAGRGSVKWLAIGMPLAVGLFLVGLFVVLLIRYRDPITTEKAAPPRKPATASHKGIQAPVNGIVAVDLEKIQKKPPPAPHGKGPERWSFERIPEGWDPVIAAEIARYFDAMGVLNPTEPEVIQALYEAREQIEKYLAGLGPEAIPTLNAILGAEPDFGNRRFLLYALGNLGPQSEEATYALLDFYKRSRDIVEARSEMGHLIEAMSRLKNETAYQQFNEQLDDESTPIDLKDKFIQALGKHPRAGQSLDQFKKYMEYEEDPNIRNHSAQALGGIQDPQSLDSLIGRYSREPYLPVRQTILGSIGKVRDESTLPFLEGQARSSAEEGIRLSASRAIWRIGTPRAMKTLRSILAEERSEKIREEIQKWLQESAATANSR